jgi:crotonobetainyl-CoA:carnitine CoA-transferase CaiB-like acyl-CoA transferase
MRTRPQRAWLEALEAAGVPCGPINTLDQVFADPQAIDHGLRFDLPHALAGSVPQVKAPLEFGATPIRRERPPPLLGEHTADVLRERLGLAGDALAALVDQGVVGVR